MKIRKNFFVLLGMTVFTAALTWTAGETTKVQAASYTVNSSVEDVTCEVGDTIKVPIHINSSQDLRGLSGKLNGNYDSDVLEFVDVSPEGIPENAMSSIEGGNFSYLTQKKNLTFKSGTLNLEFKVLKCAPTPVSVTIKDLYYTDGKESSDMVTVTSKVTVNHPKDQIEEKVTKEATCTEKGSKSVICKLCEATLETQEIPALGHKAGEWNVKKEATCTEKGSREQRCTQCNEVVKTEEIAALGHKDGKWEITKSSTFTEKGSKDLYCARCNKIIKTEVIPFKGDINGNDKIDLTDVSKLLDNTTNGDPVELEVGDLNNDGIVDLTDVSKLLGMITEGTL